MLRKSLSVGTWHTYQTALKNIQVFLCTYGIAPELPLQSVDIAFYLSYLYSSGYAANTMATHLSAIAFIHKMHGFGDPTNCFLIQKAIQGVRKSSPPCDSRLPITFNILIRLVDSLDHVGSSPWSMCMYRCMYLMAYFACLRVGEFTVSQKNVDNVLRFQDLCTIPDSKNLKLTFQKFKHSHKPATIVLEAQQSHKYCPVRAWQDYASLRGKGDGFLFLGADKKPISRKEFTSQLALSLQFCGLSRTLYKSHSFRIGATTDAARRGFSDSQIRELGRWQSDAFKRYIRL